MHTTSLGGSRRRGLARTAGLAVASLVLATGSMPLLAAPAQALHGPVSFTSHDLPTWQTNGIAWTVAVAQGKVFVGGTFSSIRPPGAPTGSGEVPALNLAVLDAATGEPTSCAPSFTLPSNPAQATVRSLKVSPDGQTLYVGGYFSTVDGVPAQHLAALDIASCHLVTSFKPLPNGFVHAIEATAAVVFYGGGFTMAGGMARFRVAAASAVGSPSPGALLAWEPSVDKAVLALAAKPDGSAIVVGGRFDSVNGSSSHALVVVDSESGATVRSFPGFIPDRSVVKDLAVDDTGFYTANEGNVSFDGRIAVDWAGYGQRWRDTCAGATQAVVVYRELLYSGSHAHDCSLMGWFPDGPRQHLLAQSLTDAAIQPWFPHTDDGLGEHVGPRHMAVATTPSGDYLYAVGEFTAVNGADQQGVTRFGQGLDTAGPTAPVIGVSSPLPGQAKVSWRQSLDTDDSVLTYQVFRSGSSTPIHTVTGSSWFWERRQMTFVDTDLGAGATVGYRVTATDGTSTATSATRTVVVSSSASPYAERVKADGASFLWRYDEPGDVFVSDATGNDNNGTLRGVGIWGQDAALVDDPSTALRLGGGSTTIYSETRSQPTTFSAETWFKTTTTVGGKLIGFGDKQTFQSANTDKHVYMADDGTVLFGVVSGGDVALRSPRAYNDGRWHHVVATHGPDGMALYLDGARVAANSTTANQTQSGYWRVGGDTIGAPWPARPTSAFFTGTVDETAIYPSALSAATVSAHYAIGGDIADTTAPTAPTDLTAAADGFTVTVRWTVATDDIGVKDYLVHRSGAAGFTPEASTLRGTAPGTFFTDVPVADGRWYYWVVARDDAGNVGPVSDEVVVDVAGPPRTVVSVVPAADTHANQGAPSSSFGGSASLLSRGSPGGTSYLRFVLPAAPPDKQLTGAVLRFRTTTEATAGSVDSHTVRIAGDAWTPSSLTWNNQPGLRGEPLAIISGATAVSTGYETAVESTRLAALLGTQMSLGITSTGGDSLRLWSTNHPNAGYRPQLILSFQ